jgi:8-oxo-dGTP diphosphatase
MRVQELNVYIVASFQDKILLMRRKDSWWEFPGGSIEWGESPEQAAAREFKEETQLIVSDLKFLGVTSATYQKGDDEKHSVYIVYTGVANSDKHILSSEHMEARWLLPREAAFLKLGLNAEPVMDML